MRISARVKHGEISGISLNLKYAVLQDGILTFTADYGMALDSRGGHLPYRALGSGALGELSWARMKSLTLSSSNSSNASMNVQAVRAILVGMSG